MTSDLFLAGMRKAAGAVSVITTMDSDGERRGLTATAVCSLSTAPPSLLVCVNRKSWVAQFAPNAGVFAVNVLSPEQEAIARTFAGQSELAAGERFSVGEWETHGNGAPLAKGAVAAFDCRLERVVDLCHPDRRSGSHHARRRPFAGLSRREFFVGAALPAAA